mgnify:CR=1 FL=1
MINTIKIAVYGATDKGRTLLDVAQFVCFDDALNFVNIMLDQGCDCHNATRLGLNTFRGHGVVTSDMDEQAA